MQMGRFSLSWSSFRSNRVLSCDVDDGAGRAVGGSSSYMPRRKSLSLSKVQQIP